MGNLTEIAPFVIAGAITLWAVVFGLVWYKFRVMRRAEHDLPGEASPAEDGGRPSDTPDDGRG
jgi:hypothetical protein